MKNPSPGEYEQLENEKDESETPVTSLDTKYGSLEAKMTNGNTLTGHHVLLTFFASIGGFLFGYDSGVISGAMLSLRTQFALSHLWEELIVSFTIGGAAIAAFFAWPMNDRHGRRSVILLSSSVFIAGAVILAVALVKEIFLFGRLVIGVGIGMASATIPMYISECSPSEKRGRLTVIYQLSITVGIFCAGVAAALLYSSDGWRWLLGLSAVPAGIQFVAMLFMPESPRWLVMQSDPEDARKVMVWLQGSDQGVDASIAEIEREKAESLGPDKNRKSTFRRFLRALKQTPTRRALMLGCLLQMMQQLSGINIIIYYAATIISMAGVENPRTALWLNAALVAVNMVATLISLCFVDRVGRRPLILASMCGLIISLSVIGLAFQLSAIQSPVVSVEVTSPTSFKGSTCDNVLDCNACVDQQNCGYCYLRPSTASGLFAINGSCLPSESAAGRSAAFGPCANRTQNNFKWAYGYCPSHYSWLAVAGMVLFLLSFAPGMGPIPWTVNSEIYPTWARGIGMATSTSTNWIFNFIVSMTFLSITTAITRHGTFYLYAGVSLVGFAIFWIILPETRGKTLEEMEHVFDKPWNCFCFSL